MNQMSKSVVISILNSVDGPPGIIHPLLVEKYSWVDQRLEELYYDYEITPDNKDKTGSYKMTWEDYINILEQSQEKVSIKQHQCDAKEQEQEQEMFKPCKYIIIENKENSDIFSEVSSIISEDIDCYNFDEFYEFDEWYMYNEVIF